MQSGDSEPVVRIRDLQKSSVDFVLENVDLAYVVARIVLILDLSATHASSQLLDWPTL